MPPDRPSPGTRRPDPEEVSASVFAALADPTRRAILAALAEHGPSTATDLSARLGISRQGVAKHLGLLADAGLVTSDAGAGRRVLFRHRSEPIKVAQSYLAALAADWDGSLARLSAFLAAPADTGTHDESAFQRRPHGHPPVPSSGG